MPLEITPELVNRLMAENPPAQPWVNAGGAMRVLLMELGIAWTFHQVAMNQGRRDERVILGTMGWDEHFWSEKEHLWICGERAFLAGCAHPNAHALSILDCEDYHAHRFKPTEDTKIWATTLQSALAVHELDIAIPASAIQAATPRPRRL
jgi:hypothetical protein